MAWRGANRPAAGGGGLESGRSAAARRSHAPRKKRCGRTGPRPRRPQGWPAAIAAVCRHAGTPSGAPKQHPPLCWQYRRGAQAGRRSHGGALLAGPFCEACPSYRGAVARSLAVRRSGQLLTRTDADNADPIIPRSPAKRSHCDMPSKIRAVPTAAPSAKYGPTTPTHPTRCFSFS